MPDSEGRYRQTVNGIHYECGRLVLMRARAIEPRGVGG